MCVYVCLSIRLSGLYASVRVCVFVPVSVAVCVCGCVYLSSKLLPSLNICGEEYIYIYIYISSSSSCCYPCLSSIASGRSSGLHPVSAQNCCI